MHIYGHLLHLPNWRRPLKLLKSMVSDNIVMYVKEGKINTDALTWQFVMDEVKEVVHDVLDVVKLVARFVSPPKLLLIQDDLYVACLHSDYDMAVHDNSV